MDAYVESLATHLTQRMASLALQDTECQVLIDILKGGKNGVLEISDICVVLIPDIDDTDNDPEEPTEHCPRLLNRMLQLSLTDSECQSFAKKIRAAGHEGINLPPIYFVDELPKQNPSATDFNQAMARMGMSE